MDPNLNPLGPVVPPTNPTPPQPLGSVPQPPVPPPQPPLPEPPMPPMPSAPSAPVQPPAPDPGPVMEPALPPQPAPQSDMGMPLVSPPATAQPAPVAPMAAPVGPTAVVGSGMGPMQPGIVSPPFDTGAAASSGTTKLLLRIVLALVVIIILVVGGFFLYKALTGGPITYSTSDLVTAKASSYSISYPKQWQDASSNTKLLNKIAGSSSGLTDIKFYVYKVNSSGNWAQSLLLAGDAPDGVSDSELNQSLQDPAAKQSTMQALQQGGSSLGSSIGCSKTSNNKSNVSFNTAQYIVQLNASLDCTPQVSSAKGMLYHVETTIGMKNSKVYGIVLITTSSDWQHNSNFYTNGVLGNFKPI
ncbi:MAG: hypothetical protein ACREHG_11310 [Candidatus Saccharimonadales bacterium]